MTTEDQVYTLTVDEYGTKRWTNSDAQYHRESGPAVIYTTGTKVWYKEDKFHRESGPAVIYADGYKAWFIEGKRLSEEEFNNRNNKVVLTIAEIAEKLNIDPSLLRIKD